MPRTEYQNLKRAEENLLKSMREQGVAKKKGRPSKDEILHKALRENSTAFFKRILPDDMEEKLWFMFIEGRIPMRDDEGKQILDRNGVPQFQEISGVSWNAFRQMVAYKRGMPAMTETPKDQDAGRITVHFNVMGETTKGMESRIKEIQVLPNP